MNTHSMKSVLGHEVIGVDDAESIGKVKHLVVSTEGRRIERLHIDGRGKKSTFVAWEDLDSFGSDRVMVSTSDATATADGDRDIESARGNLDVLGARILDTAGFEHGRVDDLTFDAADGRVVSVVSTDGMVVDASAIRSFGSYALVIDH